MNTTPHSSVALTGRGTTPLVVHVVFRLDYGGLENGVVNVANGLARPDCPHAIVALTQASDFRRRITNPSVQVYELHKRPGKDPAAYFRLYRLFRALKPTVVHTRNVGTIDCALIAAVARVPYRVHGEHGWDVHDPDGTVRKFLTMRRTMGRFVHRFVALSKDLERWLLERVGIAPAKVQRICNGVDVRKFHPLAGRRAASEPGFPYEAVVVGSVTRFSDIKAPLNLVQAFIDARQRLAPEGLDLRLMMAGDGPLLREANAKLQAAGLAHAAWLPGSREDVPSLLRQMDVFALSSLREGISNTVLEAMASGLPVVASATGGNLELVQPGVTGTLVDAGDTHALAQAIVAYAQDESLRRAHGLAGRERAEREYSIERMLSDYDNLYRLHSRQLGVVA